jgi:hypothetical protein
LVEAVHAALVSFQPEAYSGDACATLVEKLSAVEKVSAFARVRAAARAGECGAHRERGFADVSDWMARATGSTTGAAKATLETAAALESQPEVQAAVKSGELSFAQARELVKTEAAVPGSTTDLLDVAMSQSLRSLKQQARDRRMRAIDPEELHALQHAAMYHRHWSTALGNIAYAGELPPELGIPFTTILDAETDRLWLQAHQDGRRQAAAVQQALADSAAESPDQVGADAGTVAAGRGSAGTTASTDFDAAVSGARLPGSGGTGAREGLRRSALAAQAFVRMMQNGGGKGKTGRADMVIVCDLRAYRRGHAHDGEPCHIIGGGPIPVSLAKSLGRDAFLKALLHTGTELHTIAHFGRRYPAVLRTALDLGAPPDFNGNVCAAPGCDRTYHLQNDHIDPVANGGLTSYGNNQPLCPPDHRIKTERDRKAGLLRRKKPPGPDPKKVGPSRDRSRPPLL